MMGKQKLEKKLSEDIWTFIKIGSYNTELYI